MYVEFVVHEDGSISDVKASKGIGKLCDEAAVIAVKTASIKWIPGMVDGVAVKSKMVLPVVFKLANSEEESESDKNVRLKESERENTMEEMVVVGQKKND